MVKLRYFDRSEPEDNIQPESSENYLENLLKKLKKSVSHSCLYALEEDFNKCGLSLQTTAKDRMILCRIVENRPFCEEFLRDYIYLGNYGEDKEISKRRMESIMEFVKDAASDPSEIKDQFPSWQNDTNFYGKIIIVNEDIESVSDVIID